MSDIRFSVDLLDPYRDTSDEQRLDRFDLYCKLMEGIRDMQAGNVHPFSEAMAKIQVTRKQETT